MGSIVTAQGSGWDGKMPRTEKHGAAPGAASTALIDYPVNGRVPRASGCRAPRRYRGPGTMIGQHNQEILTRILRLSDDEIAELARSGALE